MKHHWYSPFAAALAAFVLTAMMAASSLSAKSHDSWLTENQKLDARYLQAISDGDINTIMQCWSRSPNALLVAFGKICKGPAQIRQHYVDTAMPGTESHPVGMTVEYWRVGELVFAVGRVTVVITLKGSDEPIFQFVDVWSDIRRKERGKWVYLVDHATMLPEPE